MKMDMDKIQFESRVEINEIIHALEEYQKQIDLSSEIVQEFIDKLNVMSMCW